MQATWEATWELISNTATAISPIVVAILGYMTAKKSKEDKAYRELKEENERLEKEKADQKNEELLNTISKMGKSIDNVSKRMDSMDDSFEALKKETDLSDIRRGVQVLNTQTEINFDYIQSLSLVVTTMAEQGNLEGNADIKHALDTHKRNEAEISKRIYKISC